MERAAELPLFPSPAPEKKRPDRPDYSHLFEERGRGGGDVAIIFTCGVLEEALRIPQPLSPSAAHAFYWAFQVSFPHGACRGGPHLP